MESNFHTSVHPPVWLHLGRNVPLLVVIVFLLKIFTELFLGLEPLRGVKGGCWCSSLFQSQGSVGVLFSFFYLCIGLPPGDEHTASPVLLCATGDDHRAPTGC